MDFACASFLTDFRWCSSATSPRTHTLYGRSFTDDPPGSLVHSILPPLSLRARRRGADSETSRGTPSPNHGAPPLGHAVHGVHCAKRDPQPDALARASVLTLTLALTLSLSLTRRGVTPVKTQA
eukprot:scaffold107121_cov60-Phaeocystis_antarctica.AAC.1